MGLVGFKQVGQITKQVDVPKQAKELLKHTVQEIKPATKVTTKEIQNVGAIGTSYTVGRPYIEPISYGIDGAFEPSVYDTLRANLYPQLFENYEVGAAIVKGKATKVFNSLKSLNETFSKPGKEIRLAPVGKNSVRGRNIVTMPKKAFEQVRESGIERIVDLRAEVNSTVNGRLSIKNGIKYVDGIEYVHVPVSYNNGLEDLTTIKRLPDFFNAMDKGNVYIGCNMGSHRTDFALALNYALNTSTKEAPPILYLPIQEATKGVQRIFNKISKMTPEDLKAMGLNEEFLKKLPKDKEALNKRIKDIINITKDAK